MFLLKICFIILFIDYALTENIKSFNILINDTQNYLLSIDTTQFKLNYRLLDDNCVTPNSENYELIIKNSIKFENSIEKSTDQIYIKLNAPLNTSKNVCLEAFNLKQRKSIFYQIKLETPIPTQKKLATPKIPKLKFLFADSIFAYDFTNILHSDNTDTNKIEETTISETTLEGSFICYLLLTNIDSPNVTLKLDDLSIDTFQLDKVDLGSTFAVANEDTTAPIVKLYSLTLSKRLDYDFKNIYDLKIQILNSNIDTTAYLRINVTPYIDREPIFNTEKYEFDITDNRKASYCIGNIKAIDPDVNTNKKIEYFLVDTTSFCKIMFDDNQDLQAPFDINRETGEICLVGKLNRELCRKYRLQVQAKFVNNPTLVSKLMPVNITIKSQNNHVEFFERHFLNDFFNTTKYHTPIEYTTKVNLESNTAIGKVNCTNCYAQSESFSILSNGTLINRESINDAGEVFFKISSNNLDIYSVNIKVLDKPDFYINSIENYHYFNNSSSSLKLNINLTQFDKQIRVFSLVTTQNGLNCNENRFKKYFKMSPNGEILIARNISFPMICYVSIQMKQYSRLKTQIRHMELILLAGDKQESLLNVISTQEIKKKEYIRSKQTSFNRDNIFGMSFNQFLIMLILSFVCVIGALLLTSFILLRKRELAKKKCDYGQIKSQSPTSQLSVSSDHHLTDNSSTPTTQLWFQQTNKDFETLDLIKNNEKTETKINQEVYSLIFFYEKVKI